MKDIDFGGKFLYEENESYFIRGEDGRIKKIPKNKFRHGQFVSTIPTYFSPKDFTRLVNPSYIEGKGWFYGENYVDRQGNGGGCGYSFKEESFVEITDPTDILLAERINLRKESEEIESRLKEITQSLVKINYALSISVPKYEKVVARCPKCRKYFSADDCTVKNGSRACKCD